MAPAVVERAGAEQQERPEPAEPDLRPPEGEIGEAAPEEAEVEQNQAEGRDGGETGREGAAERAGAAVCGARRRGPAGHRAAT